MIPTLDYQVIKNKKNLEIFKEDFQQYFNEPEENDAVIDKHLILYQVPFIINSPLHFMRKHPKIGC